MTMDHDKVLVVLIYTPVTACDLWRAEAGVAVRVDVIPAQKTSARGRRGGSRKGWSEPELIFILPRRGGVASDAGSGRVGPTCKADSRLKIPRLAPVHCHCRCS